MAVDDQALLGQGDPMADPTGQNWAGRGNDFGLPLGWEHMEDPSGRSWAGAGVAPQSFNLGPTYAETSTPYDPGKTGEPLSPPVWTGDGAAPAGALDYSGGTGHPGNWHDFSTPTNTTTGGGFFSMDDNFAARGLQVPDAFQAASSLPSTNNYRLLMPGYNKPGYIMRNGQIIDLNSPGLYGPPGYNAHYANGAQSGYPSAYGVAQGATVALGWPGQLGGFATIGPHNPG